jgi:xanthine dehydrogenase molybdopterin-binding subunit B
MKRTITIEFDRVKITTTHHGKNLMWCELCQSKAEFLNRKEALEMAKFIKAQGVAIKRENLHFYQVSDEQVLICLNSIIKGNNPDIY